MTLPPPRRHAGFAPAASDPRVLALVQIDRKLQDLAREVRQLRITLEQEVKDRGVLGSRGLTQFLLELLERNPATAYTTYALAKAAKLAGYATPNTVSLTKRLSEYRRRTGKILSTDSGWQWAGKKEEAWS